MDAQAGDILLTLVDEGKTELSKLIQYFTRTDSLWTPSHAAKFVNLEEIIEAIWPDVAISPFEKYKDAQWMILRNTTWTDRQRQATVDWAINNYLGKHYDVAKLGLEALDAEFHTTWWAKKFGDERAPICSVLVAASDLHGANWYYRDHKTGLEIPINAVVPNGIMAHAKQWPNELVALAGNV